MGGFFEVFELLLPVGWFEALADMDEVL